jgi:hypothetical protein
MRIVLLALMLAGLVACGRQETAVLDAVASERAPLWGDYRAASADARNITGDLVVERGGLLFASGAILYTRVLNPRRGDDLVSRAGDSYAAIALGPSDLAIELRRVTEQVVGPGAQGLCGEDRPTYVALAHDARATDVTLLVFTGEEPPGPDATTSRICGAFVYTAPDGARTRQGVLLE